MAQYCLVGSKRNYSSNGRPGPSQKELSCSVEKSLCIFIQSEALAGVALWIGLTSGSQIEEGEHDGREGFRVMEWDCRVMVSLGLWECGVVLLYMLFCVLLCLLARITVLLAYEYVCFGGRGWTAHRNPVNQDCSCIVRINRLMDYGCGVMSFCYIEIKTSKPFAFS